MTDKSGARAMVVARTTGESQRKACPGNRKAADP